jgi:uncharacterized protein (DUF1499 family)
MDVFQRFCCLLPLLMLGCSGTRPSSLGVKEGKLMPCPDSPNCVSTQSENPRHKIDPLVYTGSINEVRESLERIVGAMPRTNVVQAEKEYIHVECRSRLFGFVDDVEFWFDDENKVVHFRSASRKGYSDLGVNRKRMERIRERFSAGRQGR